MIFKQYFTGFGFIKTGDAVKKRRFSGAVRTYDTVNGLFLDLDIQTINGDKAAKAFGCVT